MLKDFLKNYHIILASGSPRRQAFFNDLGIDFSISLKPTDEVYPEHLTKAEITDYLAQLKAKPFQNELKENTILITSDTIVWHNNTALGKPKDADDAFAMLKSMSNSTHEVITSVSFSTIKTCKTINAITKVTFTDLTDDEIWYYINNFQPFDKAGAYGIQEWIGAIGISKIEGSYNNVVGLPTQIVYKTLINMANGI
jgi:septum formation protein